MTYIIQDTLEYPFYEGDVDFNLDRHWAEVTPTEMPSCKTDEVVEEITPVFINGEWVQTWSIRKKTPMELELEKLPPKFLVQ